MSERRTEHHDRHAAIYFYRFEMEPETVAAMVDYKDVFWIRRGDRFGRRPAEHNRIAWRYPFFVDQTWDDVVEGLIDRMGGPEAVSRVKDKVRPKAAWLRLALPIVASPWQESGGLSTSMLGTLASLELDFDTSVFEYDPGRATHGPLDPSD